MRFIVVALLLSLLSSPKKWVTPHGIIILMYHRIGTPESRYCISPERFRSHLEKLYQAGFTTARLDELIQKKEYRNKVVLRFDDSWKSQFNYLDDTIDPHCAVGILLDFHEKHPSFGKHALFAIIPTMSFQQPRLKKKKLQFLVDQGMELVNHGFEHVDITYATQEEVDNNFGKALAYWQKLGFSIAMIATPYGAEPQHAQLNTITYKGASYPQKALLYAGSDHTGMGTDPFRLPCFEVTPDSFDDILAYIV